MKTITTTKTVYEYDELPEEAKEKVLRKLYDINVCDEFWYDYDGKTGFSAKEIRKYHLTGDTSDLLKYKKLYFDIGRGGYIQFIDAEFLDENTARQYLGVPKDLWNRVSWYVNDAPYRETNTRLEYESADDREFTPNQTEILDRAVERFADKISEALTGLRDSYEYATSREGIEETIHCNEYEFDIDGNIC